MFNTYIRSMTQDGRWVAINTYLAGQVAPNSKVKVNGFVLTVHHVTVTPIRIEAETAVIPNQMADAMLANGWTLQTADAPAPAPKREKLSFG